MDLINNKTKKEKSVLHYIEFGINLNEGLGITSVSINYNTTNLPSNSELVKKVAFTLLKSIYSNKEDLMLQDLLNELDIVKNS